MKPDPFRYFRFADVRKDKWKASEGRLSQQDITWLKWRKLVYTFFRIARYSALLPISLGRFLIHIPLILDEFERLHFSPLRKINRGSDCVIDRQTWIVNGQNIQLGAFVKISAFSSIMAGYTSTIKIGTNTIITPGVTIVSFKHGIETNGLLIRYQKLQDSKENSIYIGDEVWNGANIIIFRGV